MPTLRNGKTIEARENGQSTKHESSKEHLVIIGSGWAGYAVMQKVDRSRYTVTMISPTEYFVFTPLLSGAAVGTNDFNSVLEPVRRYPEVDYHQAYARHIDFSHKTIECSPAVGSEVRKRELNRRIDDDSDDAIKAAVSYPGQKTYKVHYDKLVIAVGCGTATFGIEGAAAHSFMLKDADDAQKIRSRIIECFELASQPTLSSEERKGILHFAVVGGGPTGVEFAGELHDFLTRDLAAAYPELRDEARITIYDVAPGVLQGFDKSLSEFAAEKFKRQGVAVKGESHITRVHEGHLEIKEEGNVPFGMLVWATGLEANPLINSIKELKKDEKTHVLRITNRLNVISEKDEVYEDVFCLGDCSALEKKAPPTGQTASQQAEWLARNLNALVTGSAPPKPFVFKNHGNMTYLGDLTAIIDRSDGVEGPEGTLTGKTAWLLWRSAYLYKSLSFRNQVSLVYHWLCTWIAGRRISRF
ncbi:hypothetical protein JCM10908_004933 [Rhodotorula pacifica]|uniref:uncharacterized protein n=1 Tax=Rhodotorula pacifica TaxID=1495444 RepID=UPI0031781D28